MRSARIYALALLALASCGGTRDTSNKRTEAYKIENTYTLGSKTVLLTDLSFEPIDALKPFSVDGRKFENVKIKSSSKQIVEKWRTQTVYRTKKIYRTRTTARENNAYLWIGLASVLAFFIFLWFYLPKLRAPSLKP